MFLDKVGIIWLYNWWNKSQVRQIPGMVHRCLDVIVLLKYVRYVFEPKEIFEISSFRLSLDYLSPLMEKMICEIMVLNILP